MKRLRRVSIYISVALATLLASVFLFGQTVNAQEIEQEEQISISLLNGRLTLEQKSQLVFDKFERVEKEADEIEDIEDKKEFLSQEIEKLREELKSIRKQIEDKKAREEARRLEAIRLEEARQAAAERRAALSRNVVQSTRSYSTLGNTYAYGYCTWYVKNQLGWVPNGLGNANTWFYRAQRMGLSTGTTPRVGAVGTSEAGPLGHVVVVRAVHGNGTITISEMNYTGWKQISSRTVSANQFRYIYN